MAKRVLIRPLLSEKANEQSEKISQYSFIVDKSANKIEIRNAIEAMYGVNVISVNTSILPGKTRTRYTRSGMQSGVKPSYKKAFVTLVEGDEIDFYENL